MNFLPVGIVLFYFAWVTTIILKACCIVTWSWWLVLFPLWLPFSVIFFFATILCIIFIVFFTIGLFWKRKS